MRDFYHSHGVTLGVFASLTSFLVAYNSVATAIVVTASAIIALRRLYIIFLKSPK